MKPLYWVSAGLAIVVFTRAPDGVYDVAEVVGSLFVLVGWLRLVRAVPTIPLRLTCSYLVVIALLLAAVTAAPGARTWLDDADPAVVWASSLPALGFQAGLAHALAVRSRATGVRSGWWWRGAEVAILAALLADPLYNGAGWHWLYGAGTIGLIGVLLVIVLGIAHGAAPWAGGGDADDDPGGDELSAASGAASPQG